MGKMSDKQRKGFYADEKKRCYGCGRRVEPIVYYKYSGERCVEMIGECPFCGDEIDMPTPDKRWDDTNGLQFSPE